MIKYLKKLFTKFFHIHVYTWEKLKHGPILFDGAYIGEYETYRLTCSCNKIKLKTLETYIKC